MSSVGEPLGGSHARDGGVLLLELAEHTTLIVESVHADDLVPAGRIVEPGELDRGLVRLRAAVAEEALAAEGALGEGLGEGPLGLHVPRIRDMNQLPDLLP